MVDDGSPSVDAVGMVSGAGRTQRVAAVTGGEASRIELRCTGVDADVVASGEMVDGRRREMSGVDAREISHVESSPPYEPSHPPPRTARVVTGCGRVVVSFM